MGCNRITAIKKISILPRAELLTAGQILKDDYRILTNICFVKLFASAPQKDFFFTATSIVSPQKAVTVRLLNVGEETKIIYRGTVIGQMSEVRVVELS